MKTISKIVLISLCMLFGNCKKSADDKRGYKCENGQCKLVDDGADYLTLDDCKSECAVPNPPTSPGTIVFETSIDVPYSSSHSVKIRVSKSSDDLSNGFYVAEKDEGSYFAGGPTQQSKVFSYSFTTPDLTPATYYYTVTGTKPPVANATSTTTVRNGQVNVESGKSVTINNSF